MNIPEGVSIQVEGNKFLVSGPNGKVEKEVKGPVTVTVEGNEVIVQSPSLAIKRTWESIIANAFEGVTKGFERRLKMLHAHFPFTIEVKGDKAYIKNFLGEKKPRTAKIMPGTKVEVKGKEVIVSGPDKELVGQTVANLKQALKIKKKDPRVFQDGLYEV